MAEQVHYRTLPRMKRNRAITESAESDHSTDDTATSDFSRTLSRSLDDLSLVFPRPPILAEERAKFTSEVMSKRKKIGQEIEELRREVGKLSVECGPAIEARYTYFLKTRTLLQEVFRAGKMKFRSESTSEGMLHLLEKGLVNDTPEDVALCLYGECFDKVAIGKYLGKNSGDPFRQQVLQNFLRFVDVTGLNLVEAIRELVKILTLPDDPKYIEQIMNEFGKYYHLSNPKKFCSADTCSACAVSLVLLSNNLHSTQHQRVSLDEYVFMHIQFSSELSLETLTMFYEAVRKEPLQVIVQLRQKIIEHIGFMELERTSGHWKKYEFKLFSEGCLQYGKAQKKSTNSQKKSTKTRIISLAGLNVREIEMLSPKKDQFIFELFPVDPSSQGVKICTLEKKSMVIMENGVRFRLKTCGERNDWIAKIRTQLNRLERRERESYRSSYFSEQTDIKF